MYPGDAHRDEVAGLRAQLSERDRSVAALSSIVDRQISLLERYDAVMRAPLQPASAAVAPNDKTLSDTLDRTVLLLDQAVAGVEKRARDVAALEAQLDKALGLLDQSLRNQEAMTARGFEVAQAASPAVEATLAKYDQMLERSLAALETAFASSQSSQKEVGDRDRLLQKTIDLLESTVESSGAGKKTGLFGRLFL